MTHHSAPATAASPALAASAAAPAKPAPLVDLSAKPAQPHAVQAKPASKPNDQALELGGGALALVALGGAAFAISRRRRHAEDEWQQEESWDDHEAMHEEPVVMATAEPAILPRHDPVVDEQPAMVAPAASAFTWGDQAPAMEDDQHVMASTGDDRAPGESWVDRAYRGPSAENPSLSLRKRLKRAAFFDQRERAAAAGDAVPVEADAGLPESAAENQRELESA